MSRSAITSEHLSPDPAPFDLAGPAQHAGAQDGTVTTAVEPAGRLATGELEELLSTFNNVTHQLQVAHVGLQSEVARLQNELRQTNEQLRRSRELAALGQMAAGIAHEIRNPLGCIRLYAGMLRTDLDPMPESKSLVERIDRAALEMDAIVADVLAFAREITLRRTPTPAGELVAQALRGCAAMIQDRDDGLRLGGEHDRSPLAGVPLPVDPMLINQVLTNLMRNAIEAMNGTGCLQVQLMATSRPSPEADPVEVDHPHESEFIAISIIDEGPGIAPEVLERVFNPFFTTRPHGTGLGLAIAHRIADAHEGVIELRNRTEGGLQATLHLPRRCHTAVKDADADDDVTARRIAAAMSGEIDPRLLLDDDDDDNDGIGSLCARHETDCHEMITNPGTCDRADRSGEANRLIADEGGMNPDPTLDSTVAACSANEVATQHRPEGGRLGKARRRPDAGAAAHRTFRSRSAAPR